MLVWASGVQLELHTPAFDHLPFNIINADKSSATLDKHI